MKGLSALISAFILIALAISIGSFLTTGLMQTVQEGIEQPQFACTTNTYYTVDDIINEPGQLSVKVLNGGDTKLYGFGLIIYTDGGIKLVNSTALDQGTISKDNPLTRGHSAILKAGVDVSNINEIVVTNEVCGVVSAKKEL